jgi:hypothetical protein
MKEEQSPRMKDLQRRFRQANVVLAVIAPILIGGAMLLDAAGASEGVMQAFGMAIFFSGFVLLFVLDARYERRQRAMLSKTQPPPRSGPVRGGRA